MLLNIEPGPRQRRDEEMKRGENAPRPVDKAVVEVVLRLGDVLPVVVTVDIGDTLWLYRAEDTGEERKGGEGG